MSPKAAPKTTILNAALKGETEMTNNIGTLDRAFRAILGIVLLAAPFVSGMTLFSSTTATVISVAVGAIMLGTSAIKFCPLYRLLGVQTCKL